MIDTEETTAHLENALYDLEMLRSTIHDGLSGRNDLYLKTSMLLDLDAAEASIRRAL